MTKPTPEARDELVITPSEHIGWAGGVPVYARSPEGERLTASMVELFGSALCYTHGAAALGVRSEQISALRHGRVTCNWAEAARRLHAYAAHKHDNSAPECAEEG